MEHDKTNSLAAAVAETNSVSGVVTSVDPVSGVLWYERFLHLEALDFFTLSLNFIIFLFARQIVSRSGKLDLGEIAVRVKILRGVNWALFTVYMMAVGLDSDLVKPFSQSCLVILFGILTSQYMHGWILSRYGHERTVQGESRMVESYTSNTLALIALVLMIVMAGVLLINIWGQEDWLKTTSVLGVLAVFIFATKDYWLKDFISGIILIGNGHVERGSVVRVEGEGILAVVMETRGTTTLMRDLVRNHNITLPNSKLLNQRVDILATDSKRGVRDYVEYKIGYGTPTAKARDYLYAVWKHADTHTNAIDMKQDCRIVIRENDDHAVTWRMIYKLKAAHSVVEARNAVRLAAYELQEEHGVELATPLTHVAKSPVAAELDQEGVGRL